MKKENEHTPGPWEAVGAPYRGWHFKGGFLGEIRSKNGAAVYAGPASFHSIRGKTPEEAEANARLITAAPDLLEMTKEGEELCCSIIDDFRDRLSPAALEGMKAKLRRFRAAIAKAEGNYENQPLTRLQK